MNTVRKKFLCFILFMICAEITHAQSQDYIWCKSMGTSGDDSGVRLASDNQGNIYAVGIFSGTTIHFDDVVLTNTGSQYSSDIYLTKYNPDGKVLWSKSMGGNDDDKVYDITLDENANVYLTGLFLSQNFSLGSLVLHSAGSSDVFLAKYDSTGHEIWAKSSGYAGSDAGARIKTDLSGNLYITGQYSDSISFDSIKLKITESGNTINRFIVKYLYDGSVVWAQSAPESGYDCQLGVGLNDNVYIAAAYTNSVTFGSTTLTNSGSSDSYIVKYDVSGNLVWAKALAPSIHNIPLALTCDQEGNPYLTGVFSSQNIVFGSDTLKLSGYQGLYLLKYDIDGNPVWGRSPQGDAGEAPACITSDANGNIFLGGFSSSKSLTLGNVTLTKTSSEFGFLALSYDALGNALWANWTNQEAYASGVTIDPSGNSYFTGTFYNSKLIFGSTTLLNTYNGNDDIYLVKIKAGIITANVLPQEQNTFFVSPNPSTGSVKITAPYASSWNYKILSSTGICVGEYSFEGNEATIHLLHQSKGIYYIQLYNETTAMKTESLIIE